MNNLFELVAVASGGAIGAILRFVIGRSEALASIRFPLPWATLLINVLGCFLIGVVSGMLQRGEHYQTLRTFLIPGVLGGFTTYSAFAFESYTLVKQESPIIAGMYIALTVIFGLVAVVTGSYLTGAARISS